MLGTVELKLSSNVVVALQKRWKLCGFVNQHDLNTYPWSSIEIFQNDEDAKTIICKYTIKYHGVYFFPSIVWGFSCETKSSYFFADYSFLIFLPQRGVAFEREGGMSQVERVTEFTLLIRVLSVNMMFCCPKKKEKGK